MRKILLFILITAFMFNLSGCTQFFPLRTEITDLEFISVIGIDKGITNPDNIALTLTSEESPQGANTMQSGGGAQAAQIVESENSTVNEANASLNTYNNKDIFLGDTHYILIGEDAAKEDLRKYLDFITRNPLIRFNTSIYVVKGSTARDVLEKSNTGAYLLSDRLETMEDNAKYLSVSSKLPLIDLMQDMDSRPYIGTFTIPVMSLMKRAVMEKDGQLNLPDYDINLSGYGVFKNFKLVTYLDENESRALSFLKNNFQMGVLNVKDQSGNFIGLDLYDGNCKFEESFDGDKPKAINIEASFSSNISEIHSTADIFTKPVILSIETQQSQIIKGEIAKVVQIAQQNNADFIGLGSDIEMQHPLIWYKLKNDWVKIFPSLKINVTAQSAFRRTYIIREPNGFNEQQ